MAGGVSEVRTAVTLRLVVPRADVLLDASMLFLLKFSLIELDLSLASNETRRNEFRNVSRSSETGTPGGIRSSGSLHDPSSRTG